MTSVDSPLGRPPSIAERVADVLRDRITEGFFQPGARLSEEAIGGELKISRNTLREAFRLLTHERLLLHEPYRGVSVRVLSAEDVVDLYRVRKVIECGAVPASGRSASWAGSRRPWTKARPPPPNGSTGRPSAPPTSTSTRPWSPWPTAPGWTT